MTPTERLLSDQKRTAAAIKNAAREDSLERLEEVLTDESKAKIGTPKLSLYAVSNLLVSAFEGGSNYWYFIESYEEPPVLKYRIDATQVYKHVDYPINKGGGVVITTNEGDDMLPRTLNLASIRRGIGVMYDKYPRHFGDVISGNDDGATGDVFLQCCLFGEVVYG